MEADSFGVLYEAVCKFTRHGLTTSGTQFNHNTIFVVGGECHFKPDIDEFAVVVLSENFLWNAYRQSKCGQPSLLCLDMSWQYTHEKVGLYALITVASGSPPLDEKLLHMACSHVKTMKSNSGPLPQSKGKSISFQHASPCKSRRKPQRHRCKHKRKPRPHGSKGLFVCYMVAGRKK
jgi:hypothetical protein